MSEAVWMLHTKRADFNALADRFGISPVTARIIRNRGLKTGEEYERYLNGTLKDLHSPWLLPDLKEAVAAIKEAVASGGRIRIVGDYDIDGVCSVCILFKGLKRVGAGVDYVIPERVRDGYGINERMVTEAARDGVSLLLTCDNGISAIGPANLAGKLGLTMIVTDHHDILMDADGKELLPSARALVNPKRKDSAYPFPEICGAMVAFKLVGALYETFRIPKEEWFDFTELAAVATIGDVMKLQDENRIIVREGLHRLAHASNIGLRMLIEENGLDAGRISAYQVGFVLGPCLNAGGRLESAQLAVSLLLSENGEEARQRAGVLKSLNEKRKCMTQEGLLEAVRQVESDFSEQKVLVIFLADCHESLAGVIAGKLREKYHRPAFVIARGEGMAKGSGRSIEAYPMSQALSRVQDLLIKFGGHPMAAGFSLKEENIDALRARLNADADRLLSLSDLTAKIWIDVALPFEYATEALVNEMIKLEPFGQGNERPLFAQKGMRIRSAQIIGRNRNAVRLRLENERRMVMEAVAFTDGDAFMAQTMGAQALDIVYYPTVNTYRGKSTLQLVLKDWKAR